MERKEGLAVVGLPLMSETNEDVRVEKTNPLEGDEGIDGPVEDERSEEDEGGAVVEAEA
jgi:hypothetical protein